MKTLYYCKRTGGKNKFEIEEKWFYEIGELNRHEFNNNRTEHRRHEEADENKVYDCYLCISAERAYFRALHEQERQDLINRLNVAIGGLTQRQREIIRMVYWDNLLQQKVADELGLDKSTISKYLTATYKKLRKLMR